MKGVPEGVLRRIFGPKRGEISVGCRKLLNKELDIVYSSPNVVMVKSRKTGWVGSMLEVTSAYKSLIQNFEGKTRGWEGNIKVGVDDGGLVSVACRPNVLVSIFRLYNSVLQFVTLAARAEYSLGRSPAMFVQPFRSGAQRSLGWDCCMESSGKAVRCGVYQQTNVYTP
jgi:hypothetical protein